MAPKNDNLVNEAGELIPNFSVRDCKLLAAAFICSIGPDKYDYDLMATLTGNTSGSLKKMWPPIKKKAIEHHASFGTFLGAVLANGEAKVATPKATPKKRKVADEGGDDDGEAKVATPKATPKKRKTAEEGSDDAGNDKTASPVKGKGRPKKQVKKEEPSSEEEAKDDSNGDDGQAQETTEDA